MTDYFVKTTGSDSNSGRSDAQAWKTIGHVNGIALLPGDRVLFNGGDTFSDHTLFCTRAGTVGNPITFGSYGTGKAKLAVGSLVFITASFQVIQDLTLDSQTTGNTVILATDAVANPASNVQVLRCDLMNSNQGAINVNKGPITTPGSDDANWLIDSCTITNVGDNGILMCGSNAEISNTTIHNTGWNDTIATTKYGILARCNAPNIHHNTLYDIALTATFQGAAVSCRGAKSEVHHNRFTGNPSGSGAFASFFSQIQSGSGGTSFLYQNIVDIARTYLFYFDTQGSIYSDWVIVNNTNTSVPGGAQGFSVANASSRASIIIANNGMSMSPSQNPAHFISWKPKSGVGNLATYNNAWRRDGGSIGSWYNWNGLNESYVAWQAHTGATGDITSTTSPNLDGNFMPQVGSPWINAGSATVAGMNYVSA